jgi:ribosomal protein L44E
MGKSTTKRGGRKSRSGGLSVVQRQLVAHLRLVWSRYDSNKKQVKDDARVYVPVTKKDGTPSKKYDVYYRCDECKELFRNRTDVHIHHKTEVGATPGWPITAAEWGAFLERLFCDKSNLVCICVGCHHKTHGSKESEE